MNIIYQCIKICLLFSGGSFCTLHTLLFLWCEFHVALLSPLVLAAGSDEPGQRHPHPIAASGRWNDTELATDAATNRPDWHPCG